MCAQLWNRIPILCGAPSDLIHVVGYGLIDSLGNNPNECFTKMLDGLNYSKEIKSEIILPAIEHKTSIHLTYVQKLKLHAVEQAIRMSNLPISRDVAVILSSVTNDMEISWELYQKAKAGQKISPKKMVNRIYDIACSHVATHYGFMGPSTAFFASCATSLISIDYAMRLAEEHDYVIVGAGDHGTLDINQEYYRAVGALGTISKPFAHDRDGFVLGDGAGVLILQSEKKMKEYGSTSYAVMHKPGITTDAFDVTKPRPDGLAQKMAMEKAIGNFTIDSVCAHATSTPVGDDIEFKAIRDITDAPIWAPKSKIGHTLSAAGVIETIYCIESLHKGIIPHIQNLDSQNQSRKARYVLNNSFGFGGKNASVVIEYNPS